MYSTLYSRGCVCCVFCMFLLLLLSCVVFGRASERRELEKKKSRPVWKTQLDELNASSASVHARRQVIERTKSTPNDCVNGVPPPSLSCGCHSPVDRLQTTIDFSVDTWRSPGTNSLLFWMTPLHPAFQVSGTLTFSFFRFFSLHVIVLSRTQDLQSEQQQTSRLCSQTEKK